MQAASNRIRTLRTSRNLSLAAVAATIGVDESTVSRWETGKQGVPDHRKVQLADFFGVSVAYLMGWSDGNGDGNGERVAA